MIGNSNGKMNLKILMVLGFAILFFLPSTITIAETKNISIENSEKISFNYVSDHELIISFTPQDIIQDKLISENGQFTTFHIPNKGFIGNLGKPQLPLITKMIAVPTKNITIKILNSQIGESKFVGKIYPAQSPQLDNGKYEKNEFIIDEPFYQQDIEYPGILSDIVYNGKIRDINFIKIEFYPIQYNPKKETATIYNEINIELSWESIDYLSVESDFSHSLFTKIYENTFSNWQGFIDNTQLIEKTQESGSEIQDLGCDYIIITHPDFYSEISELANWKHAKGYKTHLVDTTVTGSTPSAIKQYIQDAYDTWEPRPSYLLLVGDAEFIPPSSNSTGTDLYYATVDGSDYFPDIFYGRIPVDSPQEVELIVDKIITYEQTPPSLESFYENFVVAAYFQDDELDGYETRRFVRTSEEIRDYMLSINYHVERIYCTESYVNPTHYNNGYYGNGELLPPELLRPTFPWDGDTDDIINAIESGIFILNHRDHGFEYGWGDPYFDTSNVSGLTNGELLPVVFSINCLTGRFDDMECFAEEFLRKDEGGAVAVFAATRESYSGYNDFLCRGFYDAQWQDFDIEVGTDIAMYTLGELLNYGKVYMTQTWGNPWGYEDYTFELFHVFGDPTMEVWTAFPEDLVVDHPDMVQYGSSNVEVYVEDGYGSPVERALVCLIQENGFYAKSLTDKDGYAKLEIEVEETNNVTLLVTAHNFLYYYAELNVDVPVLKISKIKGGLFNIEATIKNEGYVETDDVNWEISLEGGIILFGRTSTGTLTNISAGGEETVISNMIFGLGPVKVKFTVNGPDCYFSSDRGGKVFFVYIHVNLGGD